MGSCPTRPRLAAHQVAQEMESKHHADFHVRPDIPIGLPPPSLHRQEKELPPRGNHVAFGIFTGYVLNVLLTEDSRIGRHFTGLAAPTRLLRMARWKTRPAMVAHEMTIESSVTSISLTIRCDVATCAAWV